MKYIILYRSDLEEDKKKRRNLIVTLLVGPILVFFVLSFINTQISSFHQQSARRGFNNLVYELKLLSNANGKCLLELEPSEPGRMLSNENEVVSLISLRSTSREIAKVGQSFEAFDLVDAKIEAALPKIVREVKGKKMILSNLVLTGRDKKTQKANFVETFPLYLSKVQKESEDGRKSTVYVCAQVTGSTERVDLHPIVGTISKGK